MLLESEHGFRAKRYELAFLFGSFQPDCNPLTYLKGSRRARKLRGHNFTNSRLYIESHIKLLQARTRWNIWQYYTLGKLTHYLADAFTYPHNEHYPESLIAHRQYEADLRQYLADYLENRTAAAAKARAGSGGRHFRAPCPVHVHRHRYAPGRAVYPAGYRAADGRLSACRRLIFIKSAQKYSIFFILLWKHLQFPFSR